MSDVEGELLSEIYNRHVLLTICMEHKDHGVPEHQLCRLIVELHQLLKIDAIPQAFTNFTHSVHDAAELSHNAPESRSAESMEISLDSELQNIVRLVGPLPIARQLLGDKYLAYKVVIWMNFHAV